MVIIEKKLIVFGGKLTEDESVLDEMWQFHTVSSSWENVQYSMSFENATRLQSENKESSLSLVGHSATVVDFKNGTVIMLVMFGYHPVMELAPFIYEYNVASKTWSKPETDGYSPKGLYEHTAVYDPSTYTVYIHGGFPVATKTNILSSSTLAYNVQNRKFTRLADSSVGRYLHGAAIWDNVMFVFGGSTYTHKEETECSSCFAANTMAYSIKNDRLANRYYTFSEY